MEQERRDVTEKSNLILYYCRPFISLSEHTFYKGQIDDHTRFTVSLQEAVNLADELHAYRENDFCYPRDILDQRFINPKVREGILIHYLDVKMCNVSNRQEAFKEIAIFMYANSSVTDYTSIERHGDALSIYLWGNNPKCHVKFTLDTHKHKRIGYGHDYFDKERHFDEDDILPTKHDKYYQAYLHYKSHLKTEEE